MDQTSPKRRTKQLQIGVNENFNNSTQIIERIEAFKTRLNLSSNAEVLDYFIPKTQEDFFEHEWNAFKNSILKCLPENEHVKRDLIHHIEHIYFRGIVAGKKITNEFIDEFKNEYGGGFND